MPLSVPVRLKIINCCIGLSFSVELGRKKSLDSQYSVSCCFFACFSRSSIPVLSKEVVDYSTKEGPSNGAYIRNPPSHLSFLFLPTALNVNPSDKKSMSVVQQSF